MGGLTAYLRERFPLPTVLTLAVGTALLLVGIAADSVESPARWTVAGIVSMVVVAFLLRTRVTDEFKDAAHDDHNYPDRPVQRGAVDRGTLVRIGLAAFAVELVAVYAAGAAVGNSGAWVWYLPVVGYSALTAAEFFAPRWLGRHFTLYFLSHQLIFVFFAVWAFALFSVGPSFIAVYATSGFVAAMAIVEILRKFEIRTNASGAIVRDTYPAVWGRTRTVVVLAALTYVVGERLFTSTSDPTFLFIAAAAIIGIAVYRRADNAIRAIAFLAFLVNGVVAFLR